MKHTNDTAKKILDVLTSNLDDGYKQLNNSPSFMAVTIEDVSLLYGMAPNTMFSICHYKEQHGDTWRDPEMIFWKGTDGEYYPVYIRNDFMNIERFSAHFEDGHLKSFYQREQADEARFANQWMKNIKSQQGLKIPSTPRPKTNEDKLAAIQAKIKMGKRPTRANIEFLLSQTV